MSRNAKLVMASMALFLAGASVAHAEFIQWQIDTSQSKLSLSISDAVLNLDGTLVTARIRNETGTSNTWNVGNSANLAGAINTNYKEIGQHNIQFLSNPLGQWTGLNSGNYRPNPSRFNPSSTDMVNTSGRFTGSTAADFPAVFAAKLRVTAGSGIVVTVDVGYMDLYNVSYDATSAVLPVSGATGGTFTPTTMNVGIADVPTAFDGVIAGVLPESSQILPDSLYNQGNVMALNSLAAGVATIIDLGGFNRRLTIPVRVPTVLDIGGISLNVTITGSVVATAVVPEPSTFVMAGVGLTSLGAMARRRYRKRPLR